MPKHKPSNRWRNPNVVKGLKAYLQSLALTSANGAYAEIDLGAIYSSIKALDTILELLDENAKLKDKLLAKAQTSTQKEHSNAQTQAF